MQKGISIETLAKTIQDQENMKRDFVSPSSKLLAEIVEETENKKAVKISMEKADKEKVQFDISGLAHRQIAGKLNIPKVYYDRMLEEAPDLLAHNINGWLERSDKGRMLRTYMNGDNKLRAFLSDKFTPNRDNILVAQAALPILSEHAKKYGMEVISANITDKRMYIQVKYPHLTGTVVGQPVSAGVNIRNSEVGCGRFVLEDLIWRLSCINGMVSMASLSQYHVGKRIDSGDEVTEDFYRKETIQKDNEAFFMKIQDTLHKALDDASFKQEVEVLNHAGEREFKPKDAQVVVEEITKKYNMSLTEKDNVFGSLIEGGEFTQWGLANAITAQAHEGDSYDRAYDYEVLGGKIAHLDSKQFATLLP